MKMRQMKVDKDTEVENREVPEYVIKAVTIRLKLLKKEYKNNLSQFPLAAYIQGLNDTKYMLEEIEREEDPNRVPTMGEYLMEAMDGIDMNKYKHLLK